MTDVERVEELFVQVADFYNLGGWRLHWCGDPWCQHSTKTLHMKDFADLDKTMQCMLHETAHAIIGKGGHDCDFWMLLELMVRHYSGLYTKSVGLNAHQTKMMHDYLGDHDGQIPAG